MKISDREKKIIVIILIIAVVALPYLFVIKPFGEKQDAVEKDIAELTERYEYLCTLNEQREFYLSEIERFKEEREVIIAKYAGGIRQENVIMFLRKLELTLPMAMTTITFNGNEATPISEGIADADGNVTGQLVGLSTNTTVTYECFYEDAKELMDTILKYKERMVLSTMNMAYDDDTGRIKGTFVLSQYAITGDGRVLAPAQIPAMPHGNESVFGTYISDEELRQELFGEDSEEGEDEEE